MLAVVILSPTKVAMPPTAVTASEPPRVPLPGSFASATARLPLKSDTGSPKASSTWAPTSKGSSAVTLSWRLGGDRQLGGGSGHDVHSLTRYNEPAAAELERYPVPTPSNVSAEKVATPPDGRDGRPAAQGRDNAEAIVEHRGDLPVKGGDYVAVIVVVGDGKAEATAGRDAGGGLGGDHQLRGRDGHCYVGSRRGGQPATGGCLERVAAADLVQGQSGERRHAFAGRRGRRAVQAAPGGAARQRDGDVAGEGRIDVAVSILGRDRQAEAVPLP